MNPREIEIWLSSLSSWNADICCQSKLFHMFNDLGEIVGDSLKSRCLVFLPPLLILSLPLRKGDEEPNVCYCHSRGNQLLRFTC